MKIKKICLVLTMLFIVNVEVVKAENIKIGNTNYFIGREFYCSGQKMELEFTIEKTSKIVVSDDDDNYFIWREDGVCSPYTQQDELDAHNYPSEEITDNQNQYTITTQDFDYKTAYIKATKFDANETYYTDAYGTLVSNPEEVTAENYSTYYIKVYLRYQETTEVDPNKTYYKHKIRDEFEIADISEINENNISNYYLLTTMDEINEVKTVSYMDRTLYDSLVGAEDFSTFRKLNGQIYLLVSKTNTIQYYDLNGVENTEYKGYSVIEYNNYLYMYDYYSNPMKIIIKDKETKNTIYEYAYDGSLMHFSAVEIGDILIIYDYDYDSNGFKITYINKYELLEGANQTYNGNDITIKISGNYDTFKELRINGEIVPNDNYTVSKGSTIIKIKKEYLKTLKAGINEISIIYKDGAEVSTKLTIDENVSNPNTLDNLGSYILIGIISLLGMLLTNTKIKKLSEK